MSQEKEVLITRQLYIKWIKSTKKSNFSQVLLVSDILDDISAFKPVKKVIRLCQIKLFTITIWIYYNAQQLFIFNFTRQLPTLRTFYSCHKMANFWFCLISDGQQMKRARAEISLLSRTRNFVLNFWPYRHLPTVIMARAGAIYYTVCRDN